MYHEDNSSSFFSSFILFINSILTSHVKNFHRKQIFLRCFAFLHIEPITAPSYHTRQHQLSFYARQRCILCCAFHFTSFSFISFPLPSSSCYIGRLTWYCLLNELFHHCSYFHLGSLVVENTNTNSALFSYSFVP